MLDEATGRRHRRQHDAKSQHPEPRPRSGARPATSPTPCRGSPRTCRPYVPQTQTKVNREQEHSSCSQCAASAVNWMAAEPTSSMSRAAPLAPYVQRAVCAVCRGPCAVRSVRQYPHPAQPILTATRPRHLSVWASSWNNRQPPRTPPPGAPRRGPPNLRIPRPNPMPTSAMAKEE